MLSEYLKRDTLKLLLIVFKTHLNPVLLKTYYRSMFLGI
jgi:hypothetical protein